MHPLLPLLYSTSRKPLHTPFSPTLSAFPSILLNRRLISPACFPSPYLDLPPTCKVPLFLALALPPPPTKPSPPFAAKIYLTKNPNAHHPSTTSPTKIPASFSTATLLPACAIRPSRPALPFSEVERDEKTSL